MADLSTSLDSTIRAIEPKIDGVSIGNVADKATWAIQFQPGATNQVAAQAALNAFVFKNIVAFDAFIARFTPAEYLAMEQKRTSAGAGALCQQWDISMVRGTVDLNLATAQNFKAALVTASVLTQARADAIFS